MNAFQNRLGKINLERGQDRPPFLVDFEAFLTFSFEIAEELSELTAKYQKDSHPSVFSLERNPVASFPSTLACTPK